MALSLIMGIFALIFCLLAIGWYVGEALPITGLSQEFGELKQWVNKHSWLKILFAGFSLYLLLFIPKYMWEEDTNKCEVVVQNTTALNENVTQYDYTYFCYETSNNSGRSVFNLYTKLLWLVGIYGLILMIIFLIQTILNLRKTL